MNLENIKNNELPHNDRSNVTDHNVDYSNNVNSNNSIVIQDDGSKKGFIIVITVLIFLILFFIITYMNGSSIINK